MSDDIQDIWHAVEAPAPSKPKVHQPTPFVPRPVAPSPERRTAPMLDVQVGNRVTVTRAGRDRIAIVRVVDGDHVSIDFDPPLPHPAPVGSYMAVRVHRRDITRIIPKLIPKR
jgi:hypothetical protein